jgi:hypothetical protein
MRGQGQEGRHFLSLQEQYTFWVIVFVNSTITSKGLAKLQVFASHLNVKRAGV